MDWLILIFLGLTAGTVGSLVGLGGGIIIVPGLLIFGNYTNLLPAYSPQTIVGSSIVILVVIGLSSTLSYMKEKRVDYKSGVLFFAGSGPGAIAGAWLNKLVSTDGFSLYFGIFMVMISFLLMVRDRIKPIKTIKGIERSFTYETGEIVTYRYSPLIALLISFFVGVLSGLFGIGGGSLMVPAMIILFGFPAPVAIATSMFMIFLSSVTGAAAHLILGNIELFLILALIPGAWIGAKLGSYINKRLKDRTVITLLRWMLVIVGIRLVWQGMFG
ncbi:sulfite exporter TauE/SafE family protein [Pseudalkalibacillus caeni]|uniref:Probable membrane transporter protein n=1 Tax=Exobacillus caeni TaxID=2574798 RepID=A0A5R9F5K9_9BACL|nr:sulfite exporter TauE/SafE family protein [Pseudalkalibacillus caeni]TLS38817.1 sulfite exporter TauE/SafE family protein [Pseudalkalibacillus caeni]